MNSYAYGRTNRPTNRKFIGSDPKTDRVPEIERMLKQRMKAKDIAEALGINRSTLSAFMARYGIRKPVIKGRGQ